MPEPGAPLPSPGLAEVLALATARLAAAGVPSPRADAELLAAHVLGTGRGEVAAAALGGRALGPQDAGALAALVARREQRVPLQHLTGRAAFRGLELAVGPGVFLPRPETETTAGVAIEEAAVLASAGRAPRVVDLCTGSGAIALALATEVPGARVAAVEREPDAHAWARRNLAGSGVALWLADAATALPELDGAVDVVVSNPPYIPAWAVPREVEVLEHDPPAALWGGGQDGLDVPRAVLARAGDLLRGGGLVVVEHAEVQAGAVAALLAEPVWTAVRGHTDLTGRPRATSARRAHRASPGAQAPVPHCEA